MDPITAKRISDQLDALTTALHRVADELEAVLHILLHQAGVTVSLTGEPAPPIEQFPDGSPIKIPKTIIRCRSCKVPWTETHSPNCEIAPARPVEHRDCEEVARARA